jgi:hypothetical protein
VPADAGFLCEEVAEQGTAIKETPSRLAHSITMSMWSVCSLLKHGEPEEIQGDQKVSMHLMITTQKVTSNVQSVSSLQTFIDTQNCVLEDRVQYSTVHISNAFCDGQLFLHVFFCTVIIRSQTF